MNEIISWSAVETAKRIRGREVGCKEVIEEHLAQLERINPVINAVVENHGDQALALATQQDKHWKTTDLPSLFGVPVTTKINIDQAGSCNSNGVPGFNKTPVETDSPLVGNLKKSGANIIGRTNTPEFSIRWFTSNPIYGLTKNPWNQQLTPGGSSGGAAASVVSGIGCIAHGNDLGGSLRYPAYCCGAATIRPSMGRVPAWNPSGPERPAVTQSMSVNGPIARTVGDVRLGLNAMATQSSDDPLWSNAANSGRVRQRPWKIAWYVDAFGEGCEPEIADAVHQSVQALKSCGHQLHEVVPPDALEMANLWGSLLFTETNLLLADSIHEHGSPEVIRTYEHYGKFYESHDLKGFLEAMRRRSAIQRVWSQLLHEYDAFLLPVSSCKPFLNDFDYRFPERIPELIRAQRFLHLVNVLGLPAASISVSNIAGVPTGIQLVGAMHDDGVCLDIAEELEQQLGFSLQSLDPSWPRMTSLLDSGKES